MLKPEDDPDLPLVYAVARGEAVACRALVDRYLTKLFRLAMRLLGDTAEAEDVCQEAFLELWRGAAAWRPRQARFATWLHQVVLNRCRDRLRRRKFSSVGTDAFLSRFPEPEQAATEEQLQRQVQHALDALPARQREAFLLCHYEGYGNKEAAVLLGISVESLESLLARARRSLRRQLAGLRHGDGKS